MGCCGKARDSVLTKKLKKILLEALEEDELLGYSATGLAKALKEGHTTALHLVALFTKHIEKVNPYINSVCGRRYKDAVFDANEADRKINLAKENGQLDELFASKPFLGVPYIAKEVLESPGLPITAGIVSRKGLTGKRWCLALKRLNEAGAILIATGNVSEGCMWYESDNKVYGRSNNPHDLSRTAGGSSGGNSALVAAYCAPFAISSDVGGSIRIPSFFNGLFGHKASGGSVPNAGMSPGAPGIVERYCQLGPSCRHVEDLLPLLQIISGKVSEEESTQCSFTEEELQQMKYHEEREWKCSPGLNIFTRQTKILLVWDQPKASLPVHRRGQDLIEAQRRVKWKRNR